MCRTRQRGRRAGDCADRAAAALAPASFAAPASLWLLAAARRSADGWWCSPVSVAVAGIVAGSFLLGRLTAVATISEIVNLALAQGNIGKPVAGLLPVRGHSNVQGDRTMGIGERPPAHFLDRLGAEFGFEPPRENGYATVDAIRALRDGQAKIFIGLGGNFVQAAPGHRGHRCSAPPGAAHGAYLDQDQQIAPDLRYRLR